MADLVERLRFQGRFAAEDKDQCAARKVAERNEAADEIARLREERRGLVEAMEKCIGTLSGPQCGNFVMVLEFAEWKDRDAVLFLLTDMKEQAAAAYDGERG